MYIKKMQVLLLLEIMVFVMQQEITLLLRIPMIFGCPQN